MLRRYITTGIVLLFLFSSLITITSSYSSYETNKVYTIHIDENGTLSGYVKDISMNPIEGARVQVYFHETYEENYTDSSGYYHVTNIPICYCLKNATVSKEGYRSECFLLSIDETTIHNFTLTRLNIEIDWWPCFQHDPQNIGYSTSEATDNNEMLWWYAGEDRFSSSPAVLDGRVYTGCANSKIYCFDALTGDVIWIHSTNDWWLVSSPLVYDNKVYIGTAETDKNLYCLDSETGIKIWEKTLVSGTVSSPIIVDNKLYIGSHGRNVYCLDPENGDNIWIYSTGGIVESSPAVYDGRVYVGSWDNKLYCLDADTGNQIWNYTTGDNVVSSPTVFNDNIYFGSYDHNIYCLDAETGNLIWNTTTGNFIVSSPAIAYDKLYIGGLDSKIYCLNIYDGSNVWNFSTKYGNRFSPVVADGNVYVGCVDSNLYCLDAETGDVIWSYRISGGNDGFGSSCAIADGRIYIGGHDNKFYCFGSTGGNQPPNKPNKPQGKISGKAEKEYIYSTRTDDIDGDLIWYTWNWGDWTYTELVGPYHSGDICEVSNLWYRDGIFNITVFATDEHGVSSEWSDPLSVSMPKTKEINPFLKFLEQHPYLFPLLRHLLRL